MKTKIILIGLSFASLLVFTGCAAQKTKTNQGEPVSFKQDLLTQALEHAKQMQQEAINAQDENATLRARNEELTKQLAALQSGSEIEEPEPEIEPKTEEPLNPDDLEGQYKKLQKENDELRKLVKYERELREDMMKRVEEDQKIIKDLKSRLGE